jgi:hypothetical protein
MAMRSGFDVCTEVIMAKEFPCLACSLANFVCYEENVIFLAEVVNS